MQKRVLYITLIVLAMACRDKYIPPVIKAPGKILVVEGYINVDGNQTTITLSNAQSLSDTVRQVIYEDGAVVTVQSDDGGSFNLPWQGNGVYAAGVTGNITAKYRLAISTADGRQYISDYVPFKQTPAVDSVSWQQQNDGVHVYANTHDATALTKYYKWDYIETWEKFAPFDSYYKFENGFIVRRDYNNHIYHCWTTKPSTGIFIANSNKLEGDIIYDNQLVFIPSSTERIGARYSILVKQYALTEEGYTYWHVLSKNTENLGSIFDAQPSQLQGNIHSTTNPAETVVGFITACNVQEKRLFIAKTELNDWRYPVDRYTICDTVHLTADNMAHYMVAGYIPINDYQPFLQFAAPERCADCRIDGGSTEKPAFWP